MNRIDKIRLEMPEGAAKTLKMLSKKTRIESISYAGDGWFDKEGDLKIDYEHGYLKYKVVYFYPDLPKQKFTWLL